MLIILVCIFVILFNNMPYNFKEVESKRQKYWSKIQVFKKIFDPFFTTKSSEEGTGLGMYIVHNLIEKMGGRIEVHSRLGQGSKFRVILGLGS